jgi:hypothetical protein
VPSAGRLFSPQAQQLGIDPDGRYSPEMLKRTAYAGTMASAFDQGRRNLKELADLEISTKQVQRITERIGRERLEQRNAEAEKFESLSLPDQQRSPGEQTPDLAVVQCDGGRIQIFDRPPREAEDVKAAEATAGDPSAPAVPETLSELPASVPTSGDSRESRTFWRETKIGCLITMHSAEHARDPCPQIPELFVNPLRVPKLMAEIGHSPSVAGEPPPKAMAKEPATPRPGCPEVLVRSLVATLKDSEQFGLLLAAAAWKRGFAGARRKAFLADGSAALWSLWRRWFSHYVPIVDFIHALSYIWSAAAAGRKFAEAWPIYCRWAQWAWGGEVQRVIDELESRQMELGLPEKGTEASDPRNLVKDSLTYLRNQKPRMHYAEYRRQGLPITTCHMESAVKQVSRRVKGTDKFWSSDGAEAVLQLRADYLSETNPMPAFWQARQTKGTGQRHYHRAA